MWWHRSITFPVDKSNNKECCNAVRLVNAFSPDSNVFYSYLWQPQTQQRAYASGCTEHRSRLESIAQSVNVAERLRKARIRFVTTNYDVANAHPSPSHASLSEALVDTLQEDTGLLRQRHELTTMEIQDQTRASSSDQGPAQPKTARDQRMPFTGSTTNVLTNGPITCEPNAIRLFLWDSQPTQTMCVSPRSPRSGYTHCQERWRTMLPWTKRWMRWHKTQRSKNTLSSLQANVPDNIRPPLTARGCFLARQDRLLGTLALTSTSWAAFDPNLNDGVRRHFEPGPDFAQCGFVRASHCEFGAFFFRALVVSILFFGLEALRLRSPDYEYLDRFVLGLGRKMMRGKATISTKLEDGTEKSAQWTEGRCGTSLAWYHLTRNFALVAFNGARTF